MPDFFESIVGQIKAVDQMRSCAERPVHAFMFVGPAGAGKRNAARAFAATLLNDERALRDVHPDVITVEREGASINVGQAREIARLAARSPVESDRKVLILTDFHLVEEAAPALLKTIEEASETTVFVVIAESITRELVTVASRCVKIEFSAMNSDMIKASLVDSGVEPERAAIIAESSFGNLARAHLLAADPAVVARHELWAGIPGRLNGTGSVAAAIGDEIVASLDEASLPLVAQHEVEQQALKQRSKDLGPTTGAAKALETRQKRELRRLRTDELRAGLATLAQQYGRRLAEGGALESAQAARLALDEVRWANESITFNPNETLLLQGLLVRLSQLPAVRAVRAG